MQWCCGHFQKLKKNGSTGPFVPRITVPLANVCLKYITVNLTPPSI